MKIENVSNSIVIGGKLKNGKKEDLKNNEKTSKKNKEIKNVKNSIIIDGDFKGTIF